jgi:hypothetical protein
MTTQGHIFFHSPCFDGIASAVLACDLLELRAEWTDFKLHPVTYELRDSWLSTPLPPDSAVVDFLFHPFATFFADHHISSFVDPSMRSIVSRGDPQTMVFDPKADSCAGLLWARHGHTLSRSGVDRSTLAHWADKIDSARYSSVEEALFSSAPALQLSWALSAVCEPAFVALLVPSLRRASLDEVASEPAVSAAYRLAQDSLKTGPALLLAHRELACRSACFGARWRDRSLHSWTCSVPG